MPTEHSVITDLSNGSLVVFLHINIEVSK